MLAFFVTYDVLARKWGGSVGLPTTRVTDEISGYLLALAATWGFAFALRTGGHVRVDVMFPYLARRLRTAADVLAQLLMAGFAGLVAWKIWALVLDSLESDMRSSTYLLTPSVHPAGHPGHRLQPPGAGGGVRARSRSSRAGSPRTPAAAGPQA